MPPWPSRDCRRVRHPAGRAASRFRIAGPGKSGAGSKVCGAVDRSDSQRVDPDVLMEKVAATFKTWVQDGTVKRFGTSKAGV